MYLDISFQLHNFIPNLLGISYLLPLNFGCNQCESCINLQRELNLDAWSRLRQCLFVLVLLSYMTTVAFPKLNYLFLHANKILWIVDHAFKVCYLYLIFNLLQGGVVSAMTINKGILLGFVPSGDSQVSLSFFFATL